MDSPCESSPAVESRPTTERSPPSPPSIRAPVAGCKKGTGEITYPLPPPVSLLSSAPMNPILSVQAGRVLRVKSCAKQSPRRLTCRRPCVHPLMVPRAGHRVHKPCHGRAAKSEDHRGVARSIKAHFTSVSPSPELGLIIQELRHATPLDRHTTCRRSRAIVLFDRCLAGFSVRRRARQRRLGLILATVLCSFRYYT